MNKLAAAGTTAASGLPTIWKNNIQEFQRQPKPMVRIIAHEYIVSELISNTLMHATMPMRRMGIFKLTDV